MGRVSKFKYYGHSARIYMHFWLTIKMNYTDSLPSGISISPAAASFFVFCHYSNCDWKSNFVFAVLEILKAILWLQALLKLWPSSLLNQRYMRTAVAVKLCLLELQSSSGQIVVMHFRWNKFQCSDDCSIESSPKEIERLERKGKGKFLSFKCITAVCILISIDSFQFFRSELAATNNSAMCRLEKASSL